ncbi:hypothetical protein CLV83_4285 [Marinobacterium mangrovicola]|uniref:Uncharacterized protein n=1 Tax=Marinobacterium mangrovicola TaxID=1476959 RepID=A0A4R1GAD5_9GAMM|nr:hypothetical protein CLV83_4285 [Marinobacterium mangrovicola]
MSLSDLLLYSAAFMMGAVFIFFRKPGVSLVKGGPIWKAKDRYTPLGVKLFCVSIVVGGAGIYLTYFIPTGSIS